MKLWVLLLAVVLASLEDLMFGDLDKEMLLPSALVAKLSITLVSSSGKSSSLQLALDSASASSLALQDLGANPLSNLAGGGGDNQDLQEFTPIRDLILQLETRYYSFNVNTTSGLGLVYQFLIFLLGNLCLQPYNVFPGDRLLTVYYLFNSSVFGNLELGTMIEFKNGYFQAITEVPRANDSDDDDDDDSTSAAPSPLGTAADQFDVLYIAVRAPENTNRTASWTYQIGVLQNDLVFQWDDRQWAQLVDADMDLALIVTGNLTTNNTIDELNVNSSQYSLLIFPATYEDKFAMLNSLWCAVRNTPPLFELLLFETSYTLRNGFLQQQFFVPGLNALTRYLAYLLSSFKGKDYGGAVYQPFEFKTMSLNSCKLIYDLEFCQGVLYAVPNNPQFNRTELRHLYDNQAKDLYQNFSYALQQVACNATDETRFSPIVNCDDCDELYRDWLCSVTVPRCTTEQQDFYVFRDVNQSRSDFINEQVSPPNPYYEIMPCIDNCYALVRDCPVDFNFQCPTRNELVIKSYNFYDKDSEVPTCNLVSHNILWVILEEKSAAPRSRPSILAIIFTMVVLVIL